MTERTTYPLWNMAILELQTTVLYALAARRQGHKESMV